MNKISLKINGREMEFLEQELSSILEEYFSSKTIQEVTTTAKVTQKPTEGVWFEVKPQDIDQKLFEKKREDYWQEETRKSILEAFAKMKENPEKYGKNFKTMMPQKTSSLKTCKQFIEMAGELGDHIADGVEQALEWAQRITNGESWQSICNEKDEANWYRLVLWKYGMASIVGGSVCRDSDFSASWHYPLFSHELDFLEYAVPLIVSYE